MTYIYYPGCSLHGAAQDYQMSIDAVCNKLKIVLKELENWNCCGATAAPSENQKMALVMTALNLAKCEPDSDLVVSCNACYQRLRSGQKKIRKEPDLKEEITAFLKEMDQAIFSEKIRIKHLLDVFIEDIGLDAVKSNVVKPLKELNLIPYYGCMLVRPEGSDHPEQPIKLDLLLEALGAKVPPFQRKTRCCGNAVMSTNEKAALRMIKEILEEAVYREGQAIVVTCPVCQLNLDAYQRKVNQEYSASFNMPIIYFTQAMGLAFGLESAQLGIGKGIVSREKVFSYLS